MGVQNQREHNIMLTKYEAVQPTAVSENNSSSGMIDWFIWLYNVNKIYK